MRHSLNASFGRTAATDRPLHGGATWRTARRLTHPQHGFVSEDGSALVADDLRVGVLALDVLPDVGERVAVEVAHAALVVALALVPETGQHERPPFASKMSVVFGCFGK